MKKVLLPVIGLMLPAFLWANTYKGIEANKRISGASWVRMQEELPYPQFVQFAPGKELDPSALNGWLQGLTKDQGYELVLLGKETDQLKQEHWTYKIAYNGIESEHEIFKAHLRDGKVFRINGEFELGTPASTVAMLNEQQGLQYALASVNAQTYKWELPQEELQLQSETGNSASTYYPTGDLVYIHSNAELTSTKRLAWRYNIYAQEPLSRTLLFVDATNGDILFEENLIHHADANGSAVTKYSGTRAIVADSLSPNSFQLRETGRGNGIVTLNMQNSTFHGSAVDFTDTDNFWNNVNPAQDEVAGDAHWGAEMTYDYFMLEHNRNSIDGNGFTLFSYVHYDNNFANAFWDGQRMTYGDGSGSTTALTALDIAGHEIAHGLTTFSADLIYQNESGALNESFSDIFGATIEHYARPNNSNWLIGEDIGSPIRSMIDPNQFGDPDCYDGTNWYVGPLDNGGVHINSGVQNFWYYLLVNGGSGTNDLGDAYNVAALGLNAAADVAFRNLTVYLSQSSVYTDARFYAILSAVDLFGSCSPEVGAVTNAWHAVGVGAPYVPFADADFQADATSSCTYPATISFNNLSVNGTSFIWDFGDGTTSTQLNPTHTYTDTGYFDVQLIVDGGANCGVDTLEITNYIHISPSLPCEVILPSTGVAPVQTGCSGKILDSGGENGDYGSNEFSQITIQPTTAPGVELTFPVFDVEAGDNGSCNYDALFIYDGPNTSSPLIGTYCNTTGNPGTITSSGNAITIVFNSDGGLEESGFEILWKCLEADQPPVADFQANVTYACAGEVTFEDESTNFPDQWTWDFGDGSTSTLQNPTHNYVASGTYNVMLTVSNANGTDSKTINSVVNVSLSPAPTASGEDVCVNETATLSATAVSGNVQWFDSPTATTPVSVGNSFTTPVLTTTTSYYVDEVIPGTAAQAGPSSNGFGGGGNFSNSNQYLIFEVSQPIMLETVKVFSDASGMRTIELRDSQGNVLQSTDVNIPAGEQVVTLNFNLTPGSDYQLGLSAGSMVELYRNNNGASYPYISSNGSVTIERSSAGSNPFGFYYFFYDWQLKERDCKSDRAEVVVNVTNCATGINESTVDGLLSVYPNPAKDQVTVDMMLLPNENVTLQLTNIIGQPVVTKQVVGGAITTVETTSLARGTYWLVIKGNNFTARKAVVLN